MEIMQIQPWRFIEQHKKTKILTFKSIEEAKEYFETTIDYLIPKQISIKQYKPLDRQRLLDNQSLVVSKVKYDEEYSLDKVVIDGERKTYVYSCYVCSRLKEIKITDNNFEIIYRNRNVIHSF